MQKEIKTQESAPKDGTIISVMVKNYIFWEPYKFNSSKAKAGLKGRWLTLTTHGRWLKFHEKEFIWEHTEK